MSTRESNLPVVTTLSMTDFIRIVSIDDSRKMIMSAFIDTVAALSVVTATTVELEDIGSAINISTAKTAGYMVFDTTLGQPVWAVGDTAGALWNDATGSTAATPV